VIDSVPAHITGDGLAPRITDVLAVDPDAPAIEYEGSWSTWGDLADTARQAAALVDHGATARPPSASSWGCSPPADVW
jgi:hypothetical protein